MRFPMKRLLFLLLLIPGLLEAQTVTITGDGAATTVELTGPVGPTGPIGPTGPTGSALTQSTYALLGTPADGIINYCTDCSAITPCAAGGTGAFATRSGGIWSCAKAPANLAYADLGTPSDGSSAYCTDCTATEPCAGSGTGAFAYRVAGAWSCSAGASSPTEFSSPVGSIVVGGTSGSITLDIDSSIYAQFSSGTATVSGNCTLGDTYLETDANLWSVCTSTNTWRTAVSLSDTSTAGMGFVIDEDNMASDSATKVPTQQSVKAYVTTSVAGAATTFDPGTTVEIYEEYASGLTTSGSQGTHGYLSLAVGGGASGGAMALAAGSVDHYGQLNITTGTTDNTGWQIYHYGGGSSGTTAGYWFTTPTKWWLDTVIQVGQTGDESASAIYYGLTAGAITAPTGGVYIVRDTDQSHTTWVFVICDSATDGCGSAGDNTNQDSEVSSITPTDGTYYRLRIRYDSTGGTGGIALIGFKVNDETEVTFCATGCSSTMANLPSSAALSPNTVILNRSTNTRGLGIDYDYTKVIGLNKY